jgi:multicomponent Na+:H+ antiporter subunit G
MNAGEWISALLITAGALFFLAGSVGLLRFPDVLTRLHALTKADNLGLGLVAAGVALQADSWLTVVKLGLIWLLVLAGSATVCCLIAGTVLRRDKALQDAVNGDQIP